MSILLFINIIVWNKYRNTWSNTCLICVMHLTKSQGTWSITMFIWRYDIYIDHSGSHIPSFHTTWCVINKKCMGNISKQEKCMFHTGSNSPSFLIVGFVRRQRRGQVSASTAKSDKVVRGRDLGICTHGMLLGNWQGLSQIYINI